MKVFNAKQPAPARVVRCCADPPRAQSGNQTNRRAMLCMLPLLASSPAAIGATAEVEPFLKSSGAKGFLAEEEEALLQLRKDRELQARAELERDRSTLEAEARTTQKGL